MKNIFLTISLSVATFLGVLAFFEKDGRVEFQQTLPTIEIKAKSIQNDSLEMTLPEITIRGKRVRYTTLELPEVVVVAKKHQAPAFAEVAERK